MIDDQLARELLRERYGRPVRQHHNDRDQPTVLDQARALRLIHDTTNLPDRSEKKARSA